MDRKRTAVVAVWAGVLVAVVLVAALVHGPVVYAVLALVAMIAVAVAMTVQLAVGEQHGFVARVMASSCGAFALVLVGAAIRAVAGG
ncbi:hypothetical protein QDR37_09210 [Amnibacterium sp. CER49]|uniref:hypothetical protein n=1 Tax=Amnibacterium sp. CER49 TaxID=3039161 RepID=UPI0024472185|nr:hypothetical protein [Amnibacterium sp. CER49]MDH2444122.1 hypothetical protein [Amnibacterium sp. CER49]